MTLERDIDSTGLTMRTTPPSISILRVDASIGEVDTIHRPVWTIFKRSHASGCQKNLAPIGIRDETSGLLYAEW